MAYSFDIYALGDADMMAGALNAVAAFFQDDSFLGMIKVAMVLGMIMMGMKQFAGESTWQTGNQLIQGPHMGPWSLVVPVLFAYIAMQPKVDVNVNNIYNGEVTPVGNVPLMLGLPMSVVSTVGRTMAESFETAFTPIPEAKMTQYGFIDSIDTLNKLKLMSFSQIKVPTAPNVDIDRSIQNYYVDCVKLELNSLYPAPTTNGAAIAASDDVWAALAAGNYSNLDTTVYLDNTAAGQQMSCAQAYDTLTAFLNNSDYMSKLSALIKAVILKKRLNDPAATGVSITQDALAPYGSTVLDGGLMISNRVIANSIADAETKYAASMGQQALGWALDVNNAKMHLGADWKLQKDLFMSYARPLMAFIEIISIATAPLIPFLLLAGSGRVIMGWLTSMVWVSLWPPIMSVVNYYILTKAAADFNQMRDVLIGAGFDESKVIEYFHSVKGMLFIDNMSNEWFATANMLAASTPAIAAALLGGGMMTAHGLMKAQGKADSLFGGITAQVGTGPGARINTSSKEILSNSGGFFDKDLGRAFSETSIGEGISKVNSAARSEAQRLSKAFSDSDEKGIKNATMSKQSRQAFTDMTNQAMKSNVHEVSSMVSSIGQVVHTEGFEGSDIKSLVGRAVLASKLGLQVGTPGWKALVEGGMTGESGRTLNDTEKEAVMKIMTDGFQNHDVNKAIQSNSAISSTGNRAVNEIANSTEGSRTHGWKSTLLSLNEAANQVSETDALSSTVSRAQKMRDDGWYSHIKGNEALTSSVLAMAQSFNGGDDYKENHRKHAGMTGASRDMAAAVSTLQNHVEDSKEARELLTAVYAEVSPIKTRMSVPKKLDREKFEKKMEEHDQNQANVSGQLASGPNPGDPAQPPHMPPTPPLQPTKSGAPIAALTTKGSGSANEPPVKPGSPVAPSQQDGGSGASDSNSKPGASDNASGQARHETSKRAPLNDSQAGPGGATSGAHTAGAATSTAASTGDAESRRQKTPSPAPSKAPSSQQQVAGAAQAAPPVGSAGANAARAASRKGEDASLAPAKSPAPSPTAPAETSGAQVRSAGKAQETHGASGDWEDPPEHAHESKPKQPANQSGREENSDAWGPLANDPNRPFPGLSSTQRNALDRKFNFEREKLDANELLKRQEFFNNAEKMYEKELAEAGKLGKSQLGAAADWASNHKTELALAGAALLLGGGVVLAAGTVARGAVAEILLQSGLRARGAAAARAMWQRFNTSGGMQKAADEIWKDLSAGRTSPAIQELRKDVMKNGGEEAAKTFDKMLEAIQKAGYKVGNSTGKKGSGP